MSDDPFEKKLELMKKHAAWGGVEHDAVFDAAIYVHDTLELAFAAAKSVQSTATLDHAIAVYDRIEAQRLQRLSKDAAAAD